MHRELLDALSVITEEEQRILEEQKGIDPQLYTEKKEWIVDSEKFTITVSPSLLNSKIYYLRSLFAIVSISP